MLKTSKNMLLGMALLAVSVVAVSCGSGKGVVDGRTSASSLSPAGGGTVDDGQAFVRKVFDNSVDAGCISSKIKFTLTMGQKDISVSGSLNMKRDELIRVRLTPMGLVEVGRIEFTKDYVLIMDRMHKEYIKAGYDEVDFLRSNGLDFYALQALFWNQLFIPGTHRIVPSSLGMFTVAAGNTASDAAVALKCGDMSYRWNADKTTGRINSVSMTYGGKKAAGTSVTCKYGTFKPLGTGKFPSDITLSLSSDAIKQGLNLSMNLSLGNIDTPDDIDGCTKVSDKYRQVSLNEVMQRLMKL